jgi:hypothetical protein
MSEWKFFTTDEVLGWYGERCADIQPGCFICTAWTRHDLLKQMEYEDICNRGEFVETDANADGWCCLEDEEEKDHG